jgi:CRP-like cAMP-binding protein
MPTVELEPTAAATNLKPRLLEGFAPGDLKAVLAVARQRHLPTNSVIASQGDHAHHLFLLTKGRARFFFDTREGKKVLLLWLTPGEMFGAAAMLSIPSRYLVSAETVKDSSLLVWDRPTLRRIATRYPRLLENAFLITYDYLAWYIADHVALISNTASQRLARVLICLAETIGKKVADGFEFDATNEELASAANVTHFTTSRVLNEWQRNHAIVKRRGKVVIRSLERLLVCANLTNEQLRSCR